MKNERIYEFGPFRLEVGERRLLRDGAPVPLRAKVFDTLCTLVENHGTLVTKDELMRVVWPDSVVEEGNLAHNLTVLRKALDDKGPSSLIETVSGQGYRFLGNVRTLGSATTVAVAPSSWEQRLEYARAALAAKCTRSPSAEILAGNVVGRTRELEELLAGMNAAFAGQGKVMCVTGEPGIGKTTLFDQLQAERRSRGIQCAIAIGRCSERLGETEAYLPVLEALDTLLSGAWNREMVELMKLVAPTWYVRVAPLWASADAGFASIVMEARAASRERMKREMVSFLEELSRIVPVILFMDDLHWADASTVDLLAFLSRKLTGMRLYVVAAYRPADLMLAAHPFIAMQQEMKRHNVCTEISVALLTRADIEKYVRLELAPSPLPETFVDFVQQRTEGNPLFMTELVRHLREWSSLDALDSLKGDLPESVRSTIQRRIGHLSQEEMTLLAAASIQGQEFDSRIVADALGNDAVAVEDRLHRLDHVHAFVRRLHENQLPDGSVSVKYGFAHALYQEAIDEILTVSRRAALSQASADALLKRHATVLPPVASRLAILFEAGRDHERAADFFILAAANAAQLFANEEAVSLSRRAIANAEKLHGTASHTRVLAAASQVGQLQMVLSRFVDAAADFSIAEKAAQAAGDVEAQVNAICGGALAQFYQRHMQTTREIAGRALAIAEEAGSEPAIAAAQAVVGLERMCFGATNSAEESFERCIPVLIERGPPPQALEAMAFSGLLKAWQLDYESSHRTVNYTLQRSRDLGWSYHIVLNLFVRGMALFNQGNLSDGISDLWEGMRLAEKNRERFWLSRYPNTVGWIYRELQDFETALRLDTEGARAARENGYAKPEANSHANIALDYMDMGDLSRVPEHIDRASQLFEQDVWFRWRYNTRTQAVLARYWLMRGDIRKARESALECLALSEPRKSRKYIAWSHKLLGDIAMAEERLPDAQAEYGAALELLGRYKCPLIEWRVLDAAAAAAAAVRDSDSASEYRAKCGRVILSLADSLTDERLKRQFLGSEAIRQALA
jgi:DNA-binding winged helix-turn-helix (wHTH) protein/tetratricopeptide (TPR) repeat protein